MEGIIELVKFNGYLKDNKLTNYVLEIFKP
jgi:hypothetical protein